MTSEGFFVFLDLNGKIIVMKINIKPIDFDITPSFEAYVRTKLGYLDKFVKRFDAMGAVEIWFEIRRATHHHKKGDVFWAVADLRLPKKVLRAGKEDRDPRAAVDAIKDKLHLEIEKYKTRFLTTSYIWG